MQEEIKIMFANPSRNLFENEQKLDDFLNDKNDEQDQTSTTNEYLSHSKIFQSDELFDRQKKDQIKSGMYLAEIKQFNAFYALIMDKLTGNKSFNQIVRLEGQISSDELTQIDNTKAQLHRIYKQLLRNSCESVVPFLDVLLVEIIDNETAPTGLLRLVIRTLIKVFELIDPKTNLQTNINDKTTIYNPQKLLQSLMNSQIDDHSNKIDQQELIWINIQQLIIRIIKVYISIENLQLHNLHSFINFEQIFEFFFKMLDQRGFNFINEHGQTAHFSEKIKKNTFKLLAIIFESKFDDIKVKTFERLCDFILKSLVKLNKPIELNAQQQPQMTIQEKQKEVEKSTKAISFGLKITEDIFHRFFNSSSQEIFGNFILQNINNIAEITCQSCEQNEELIKIQGQMLFQFFMKRILEAKLPLREQFEILYVKCALKPLISRIRSIESSIQAQNQLQKADLLEKKNSQTIEGGTKLQLSDHEDSEQDLDKDNQQNIGDPLLHASSYANKAENADNQANNLNFSAQNFFNDLQFNLGINFLEEIIISIKPEDLGLLFLVYDCQQFSENIITKSINLILNYSNSNKTRFCEILETLLESLHEFNFQDYKNVDQQQIHITHQRLRYMMDQKSQQKTLSRQCNIKPKLFLNKCQEIYKYIDENAPWDVASKILLYSRELSVEHVTEIIGGKEERNKIIYDLFLDKQDFRDCNLEQSLRRTMQTFRLAGVESQVVLRVMEGFSFKFHEYDTTKTYVTRDEVNDMAYLIIVIQTTMHNPSIKQKLRAIDFINQAKSNCPLSYDNLPPDYVQNLFENIGKKEIFSPIGRSWYDQTYNQGDINICNIKLSQNQSEKLVDINEFVNSADLTSKQLFNYNNQFNPFKVEDKQKLVFAALRQISSMITNKLLKFSQNYKFEDSKVLNLCLECNKNLYNYEFTSRILRAMYISDDKSGQLIKSIINNFHCGAKASVTLIPQIIFNKGISVEKLGQLKNQFGQIKQNDLLEIFQASERFFRKKLFDSQTQISKKIMILEGKSKQFIDEALKKHQQFGITRQEINDNDQDFYTDEKNQKTFSLVNIVFGYFNDQNEDQSQKGSQNYDRIQVLKKKQEKLKYDQTENMKLMNQLFAKLVNNNSVSKQQILKEAGTQGLQCDTDLDQLIINNIEALIINMLSVIKENLSSLLPQADGFYTLLFLKNCVGYLINLNQKEKYQETIDRVWQDIHIITSKLTQTQRKVQYLQRSSSNLSLNVSSHNPDLTQNDQQNLNDSFSSSNISTIEVASKTEGNFSNDSSSGAGAGSSNIDSLSKQVSSHSKGSKILVNYKSLKDRYEKKVYSQLSRHLILEIFFTINKYQIQQISSQNDENEIIHTNNQKGRESEEQQQVCKNHLKRKDIQECMREIQRIFKSIVRGPQEIQSRRLSGSNEQEQHSAVQEDSQGESQYQKEIFDDLYVIICMNKLLNWEQKTIEVDSAEPGYNPATALNPSPLKSAQIISPSLGLPIVSYNKLYKLLRNLIIYSSETIKYLQIEVYVQNFDSFIEVINNCLKYIGFNATSSSKIIPYDLIALILTLTQEINRKSKALRFEVEASQQQFIKIFQQIIDIIQTQNEFDLWLQTMIHYQECLILNCGLISSLNWDQTSKYVFLIYKNSIMKNDIEIYGQSQRQFQNIIKLFDSLLFSISFEKLQMSLFLKKSDLSSDLMLLKFTKICELHLDSTTDCLIQTLCICNQKDNQEFFDAFKQLWFNYLKMQLHYVDKWRSLNQCVQENIKRIMEYLLVQSRILTDDDDQNQISTQESKSVLSKSWEVISTFYPQIKNQISSKVTV